MNTLSKLLLPNLIFAILTCSAVTDAAANAPSESTATWETYDGVVSFKVTLIPSSDKDKSRFAVKVYVKNITTTDKSLAVTPDNERGFELSTIDSGGVKHLLHDRSPAPKAASSPQELAEQRLLEMEAHSGSAHLDRIAPGETISRTIGLTSSDLTLVRANATQCSFTIIDPTTSQSYNIASSPKVLTEMVGDAPK